MVQESITMSISKRDLCLKALLHPQDNDCRRVSNFLFINDEKMQKEEILNYLKDYNSRNCINLNSYINRMEKDDITYNALLNVFLKRIKKSKIGVRECSLNAMTEYTFFVSYGFACSECCYVNQFPDTPDHYNKSQQSAWKNIRKGYIRPQRNNTDYFFNRNVENGAVYLAIRVPVNMHHNGKYKTEKKYLNDCYRRAVKIMDKYIATFGKDDDFVFNDGKNNVVHDFREEL